MRLSLLLLILTPIFSFAQNFEVIEHYKVNYALAARNTERLIAIRSFVENNQKYLLLVNPTTLETKVDLASGYRLNSVVWPNVLAVFKNTPYVKSLELALARKTQLQNAGIDYSTPMKKELRLLLICALRVNR